MTFERALVTGASSGIGEAYARRLAADGTEVVVVARRRDRLERLAAKAPGLIEVLAADLTTDDGRGSVADRLAKGDVDLLVNNAGFGTTGDFAGIDAARVDDEVALDVAAVVHLTRAALPSMLSAGRGAVVNVSSIVGYFPTPKMAVYAGAKAFVTSFTESLAEEVHGTGVRVQALCPGLTRTEFQEVSHSGQPKGVPDFMWQTPEQVVDASLAGLAAGRTVVVPGPQNQLVAAAAQVIPRFVLRKAAGLAQRWRL